MEKPSVQDFKLYLEQFDSKAGVLRDLGIIGWDQYERAVETFLLLGGSLLLVGPHGAAKSQLSKRLAQALGVTFAAYDTSKSMWEDIMGFPDPARLMNLETRGNIVGLPRIETPTSIWGKNFVLADEINRASPDNQSKWLELILDQTMMGEETSTRWIISAMNPGYLGTNPLDLALVARYLFFISVPTTITMSNGDLTTILQLENNKETPALPTWLTGEIKRPKTDTDNSSIVVSDSETSLSYDTVRNFIKASNILKALLIVAADYYKEVAETHSSAIESYIISVTRALQKEAKYEIDIRRLRMIKRALLGAMSVECATSGSNILDFREIQEIALQILILSFPTVAGVDGPTIAQIKAAHMLSKDCLIDKNSPLFLIMSEEDACRRVSKMYELLPNDHLLHYKIYSDILNSEDSNSLVWAFCLAIHNKNGMPLSGILSTAIGKCFGKFMRMKTTPLIVGEITTLKKLQEYRKLLTPKTYREAIAMYVAMLDTPKNESKTMDIFISNMQKQLASCEDYIQKVYGVIDAGIKNSAR